MEFATRSKLLALYNRLLACFGPQHWWPAESPFEVMVGAILTQSAAWTNVEKGISNLRRAGALSPQVIRALPQAALSDKVHPCGYFNVKARKLKAFAEWFGLNYDDDLERICKVDAADLREMLLGIYGIGEETADSILLYALNKPVFVIDAYTRRVVDRMDFDSGNRRYQDYQTLFMDNLEPDTTMFNEFHALLVALGKNYCLKNHPACQLCCAGEDCHFKRVQDRLR